MKEIKIESIVWEPAIYPRKKWSTDTIDRYVDALQSGADFPPMTIEAETNRLLDGKHRLEMYKKAGRDKVPVEFVKVPEGMSVRYFAATLSARHGDRMSNADLKALAESEFEANDTLDPQTWGAALGVSKSTVYNWVAHIIDRKKGPREAVAWRLTQLGWTQNEIAALMDLTHGRVSQIVNNSSFGKINETLGEHWNAQSVADLSVRLNLPLTDCWAAALEGKDDTERLKLLDIKLQPYDVWNFNGCHDLMGDKHPGRIPGELVTHVLYFFTEQGDLVIDPMVGSGTTLDACLLMGRKCRGYDIDARHERKDIEAHNLSEGWPETTKKASLVFWDPPYYDKMDGDNMTDGYIEGSISKLTPDEYLKWISTRFQELKLTVKKGTRLAFLMSDWDSENAKQHSGHPGIFIWNYADALTQAGWHVKRQIQCPLPTQQVHPDIVIKFRADKRLARLERYILVAESD